MPIVQIQILEGRDVEKKRAMVKEVTESICKTLDVSAESVSIVISEMPREHYAVAGKLHADKDK